MDDTVLFLSAYNSTQYKATNWFLRKLRNVVPHKKKTMQSLLEKHHLSFVATDEIIASVDPKSRIIRTQNLKRRGHPTYRGIACPSR